MTNPFQSLVPDPAGGSSSVHRAKCPRVHDRERAVVAAIQGGRTAVHLSRGHRRPDLRRKKLVRTAGQIAPKAQRTAARAERPMLD
eukprot:8268984-Pyramimonas_sp.AAC.1